MEMGVWTDMLKVIAIGIGGCLWLWLIIRFIIRPHESKRLNRAYDSLLNDKDEEDEGHDRAFP